MKVVRPYRMRARAQAADATRRRILDFTAGLLWERLIDDVTLEEIAARAEVSVQTAIRIFGCRAALVEQAASLIRDRVSAQRGRGVPGDVTESVSGLFDHYEEMGDFVIRRLADELRTPEVREQLEVGRRNHRAWVERQFGPQLARHPEPVRARLVNALVVACDVYAWKLLRRDMELDRAEAEATMRRMIIALVG